MMTRKIINLCLFGLLTFSVACGGGGKGGGTSGDPNIDWKGITSGETAYSLGLAKVDRQSTDGSSMDAYFDFSTGTITHVNSGEAFTGEWDIVFCYRLFDLGFAEMPFATMKLNTEGDNSCRFYKVDLAIEDVTTVDTNLFVGEDFTGYVHPQTDTLMVGQKAPWPYLGITWYGMKGNNMPPIFMVLPDQTFVIQTREGKYGKINIGNKPY